MEKCLSPSNLICCPFDCEPIQVATVRNRWWYSSDSIAQIVGSISCSRITIVVVV
jgi:hypothetical protein